MGKPLEAMSFKKLDLGNGYTGVYVCKVHQAVHVRSAHCTIDKLDLDF